MFVFVKEKFAGKTDGVAGMFGMSGIFGNVFGILKLSTLVQQNNRIQIIFKICMLS